MIPPFFPNKKLADFSMCCIPGCGQDAVSETTLAILEGTIYLPVCKKHKKAQITKLDASQVVLENVFFSPSGFTVKCNYMVWKDFVVFVTQEAESEKQGRNPATKEPRKKDVSLPEGKLPSKPETEVSKNWAWISNIGKWMTTTGELVRLVALSDKELIGAALGIQKANFRQVRQKIAWINELKLEGVDPIPYPEEAAAVGQREAHIKLLEFEEELRDRGLISKSA